MEHSASFYLRYLLLLLMTASGIPASFAATKTQQVPNILLIVADDLGYSDIGSYGSEIATPRLDGLAKQGIRFSDFAVAPTCSTTRSMLLTGVDNHLNGLGGLDSAGRPRKETTPGYEGHLNTDVVTIATMLQENGYHTYMAGKWHLGNSLETGPENRGFESVFVLPSGAASHFSDKGVVSGRFKSTYRENGKPATLPDDFYSTSYFTDKLIEYMERHRDDDKPFFAYASYTAPHWPLQAPDEFIDKYDGVYKDGYDSIRNERLKRLQELGFIDEFPDAPQSNPIQRKWKSLDAKLKEREIRRMQVYAGMVEALDHNIGRLLDYIEETGASDNTVVIFISDNGPEGNDPYVIAKNETWIPEHFKTDTAALGTIASFTSYGPAWAGVSATPYSLYKAFPAEGGVRVPAIVVVPELRGKAGSIVREFASVLDLTPTILELAGLKPEVVAANRPEVHPLQGKSLIDFLSGNAPTIRHSNEIVGWELLGRKAIRSGKWKMLWIEKPYGKGEWQLYNLALDPAERMNLAQTEPDQMKVMLGHWHRYVKDNNVLEYSYSNMQYGSRNRHYER